VKDGPQLCPSGRCEPGAKLLGVVQENGAVAYLGEPLEIDEAFVERASKRGKPERRFRFVNPCAECGCKQWTGTRCSVIDNTMAELSGSEAEALPRCGIRPHCRWFRQSGAAACSICSLVITETREVIPADEQA
jgi:hypothetical protein